MKTALQALALILLLATCSAPAPEAARLPQSIPDLPPPRAFGAVEVTPPQRSNAQMAQDFMDLSFRMESGRALPVFTRFEGPVRVGVAGRMPPSAAADLARVLARLRSEAGVPVTQSGGGPAQITIEFMPRATLAGLVPEAACFVAPRVSSWADYRSARRSGRADWTTLTVRQQAAIFIPNDIAPQEIRDCLNEELAQALGPLNDLYRLPDSVFNDDNIHSVLTGTDMLMLRLTYAPDLSSGMAPQDVAARVPGLIARFNPRGGAAGPVYVAQADGRRAYTDAIERALGPGAGVAARRTAAQSAVSVAEAAGWGDTRNAFDWFVYGRLTAGSDPDTGFQALLRAASIYRGSSLTALHSAHVDMQLAAFALSQGDAEAAIATADRALPQALRAQNAALTATLMMVKAEALDLTGDTAAARALRLDSLGWARYGFGSSEDVRRRLDDIATLSPARRFAKQ